MRGLGPFLCTDLVQKYQKENNETRKKYNSNTKAEQTDKINKYSMKSRIANGKIRRPIKMS